MFWLSHHRPDEYHRTYAVGGVRVCARCAGLYPTMFAGLAAQLALHAPLDGPFDPVLALALPLPALADWAVGHLRPAAGSNAQRTATGVLLGISLARTLFVHFVRPFHVLLLAQALLVTAVALPVILVGYVRRKGA